MDFKAEDRYDQTKVKDLEKLVNEQVTSGTYNLDANLTLLRFYQITPESTNTALVAKILCKALMQLPNPDFKLCVHLLLEKLQSEEPVATLILLAGHLESSGFQQFWSATDTSKDLLNSVPGFFTAVRNYILHVVGITFQKVTKEFLGTCLNLEGKELDKMIVSELKPKGWTMVKTPKGDVLCVSANSENQHMKKVVTGGRIGFEEVVPLVNALQSV